MLAIISEIKIRFGSNLGLAISPFLYLSRFTQVNARLTDLPSFCANTNVSRFVTLLFPGSWPRSERTTHVCILYTDIIQNGLDGSATAKIIASSSGFVVGFVVYIYTHTNTELTFEDRDQSKDQKRAKREFYRLFLPPKVEGFMEGKSNYFFRKIILHFCKQKWNGPDFNSLSIPFSLPFHTLSLSFSLFLPYRFSLSRRE